MRPFATGCFLAAVASAVLSTASAQVWPELRPKTGGGGEKDAAVIAAAERYAFVAPVPGAVTNAVAWYEHLTRGRAVPLDRVRLLRDQEVTREKLLKSLREAAEAAQAGGILWVIFIGHGAPAPDGKDGLLVGIDVQQEADSLAARSVRRGEVLEILSRSRASASTVVLDACFSGRGPDGKPLVPGLQPLVVVREEPTIERRRLVLLTAARSTELAGPLPGLARPAFSYLALGALRGWADADDNGAVTALELHAYVSRALRVVVRDRTQTPTIEGDREMVLGSGSEKGPDLAGAVIASAPASSPAVVAPPVERAPSPPGMVAVPAGEFVRGSETGDADERPARRILLPAFAVDRTEVTFADYGACAASGRCAPPQGAASTDPRAPVTGVTWFDAKTFCEQAGKRLPTEAEWEKAARGTEGRGYPWGERPTCLRANYDVCGRGGPVPVGSFPEGATPYGVLDMAGNVWEWVADWYAPGYYAVAPARDPRGPDSGTLKAIRGGAFDTMGPTLRASFRGRADPASRHRNVGFRCAADR